MNENKRSIGLALVLVAVLVLANARILYQTEKKHEFYSEHPPFFGLDFTRLHTLSRSSAVYHLTDHDSKTAWTPGNEKNGDFDFDIELKLSHWVVGQELTPREFSRMDWIPCFAKSSSQSYDLEIYKREAINIDGEKRLPDDVVIWKGNIHIPDSKLFSLPLADKMPSFLPATGIGKDSGVWILGVRAKLTEGKGCITEIVLLDKKS